MSNRAGLPKTIIEYIKNLIPTVKRNLNIKKRNIALQLTVKQGDQMSPLLFNAVIDYAISDLPSSIGIHNNNIVKYMVFADGLVLFAKDDSSLQAQVDQFYIDLKIAGLILIHKNVQHLILL